MTSTDLGISRLAVYGTLAPGRPNAHVLADLRGEWSAGFVRGHLHQHGWGAGLGYPGIVLDPTGPQVGVQVFTSDDLIAHWDRLDEFEGEGYVRLVTQVSLASGSVAAQIYALADDPGR